MRCLILMALLAATGCKSPDPSQPPPAQVPAPESLGSLGKSMDKGDSRVAAAVTVAVENKDKPAVVEAEGKVALAHLPKPDESDLKRARARASAADQKAYDAEISKAKAWLAQVEAEWNEAVRQSKKNSDELVQARKDLETVRKELAKAGTQITDLKAQLEKADRNMWSLTGIGLFVVGAVLVPLFGWRVAGSVIACAPVAAAIPVILTSQYFPWIMGISMTIVAYLLLWRLFDYIKDKNNEKS